MKKSTKNTLRSLPLLVSLLATTGTTSLLVPAAMASAALPTAVKTQSLPSLAPMLKKALPAVVSIEVEGTQIERQRLPEELRFFFGPNFPTEQFNRRPFSIKGSGVIVNAAKGYLVTNNHVINGASKIRILLQDGRQLDAKVIGSDEHSDVALLQMSDTTALHAIPIADSDQLQVGDFAIAIGNPFGLGQTVTSGIISALGRSGLNSNVNNVESFIQTDAAINSGNSGGALVNLQGELIGINTAILAQNGGNIGIGFAIPSNMITNFIDQMVKFGKVRRVQLGISGQDLKDDVARALNVSTQQGILVMEVATGSAAEKAGIKAGDVIVSMDGKPLRNFAELRAKIAVMGTDQTLTLGLVREGKPLSVAAKLQFTEPTQISRATTLHPALQGVEMHNSEIKGIKGIEVTRISKGSAAARSGLQEGDLIVGVNRESITTVAALRRLLDSKPAVLALYVQRGGSSAYIILR